MIIIFMLVIGTSSAQFVWMCGDHTVVKSLQCQLVVFHSADAELNSMKLLLQRVLSTLSQTVTDTQSSSLLDLKSLTALSKITSKFCFRLLIIITTTVIIIIVNM